MKRGNTFVESQWIKPHSKSKGKLNFIASMQAFMLQAIYALSLRDSLSRSKVDLKPNPPPEVRLASESGEKVGLKGSVRLLILTHMMSNHPFAGTTDLGKPKSCKDSSCVILQDLECPNEHLYDSQQRTSGRKMRALRTWLLRFIIYVGPLLASRVQIGPALSFEWMFEVAV